MTWKPKRPDFERPPSADFWEAIESNGTQPFVECENCGRLVWSVSGCEDDEAQEFAKLENGVPDYTNDAVAHVRVFGHHVVFGCPCNIGGRLEEVVNQNARFIAAYFRHKKNKLTQILREAQAIGENADAIANARKKRLFRED